MQLLIPELNAASFTPYVVAGNDEFCFKCEMCLYYVISLCCDFVFLKNISDVIMSTMASQIQPHGCLLNRLFRRRSKKTSKLSVTGLCEGNSPVTG